MKNILENQGIKNDKPVPLSYEQLKQRLDAVVAENAARGEIIERMTGIFGASGYHAVQNSIDPCSALMYDAMQALKSPVAGAALAEVATAGFKAEVEGE